ncbi:ROK family transcriptional regulator [Paenibacillus sp. N1-5-1-14]|uniref:ROK family transcriptional regulator n=1 Tax=Paenibacillus radicibacter TaxID=2972488 RepID=UPI0021597146|nr:ROK family transcriptional regulator [Paenibacillus radicibacter]MCR8641316.1 ROK family transcriptional regulator [Paenibacillus radicibacter]
MKHVRGNLFLMKEINRSTILSMLQREKALSRAEIAQTTKLSATTISSLVDELIAEGFIVELGEKSSPGAGRRAIMLEISRDNGFVISIGLGNRIFYGTLSNYHNDVIAEITVPAVIGHENVLECIRTCVSKLAAKANIQDLSMIKGIGIASPGIVDESNETITYSRSLGLKDFEIARELQAYYPIPIHVMNDTNAAAFAEYYLLGNSDVKNVLYVWIYEGVGAGLIVNGQVLSGYKGRAGEVTFLNDYLYDAPSVIKQANRQAAKYDPNTIFEEIEDVIQAYEAGVPWLETMMRRVLQVLSKAVAIMMNLLGPEQVILDGWFIKSPKCMAIVHDNLEKYSVHTPYEPSRVTSAQLREKNYVVGASTIILYQLFKEKVLLT